MFLKESEMASCVASWMQSKGLTVKSEFVTPWGICDLVGLQFDRERVDFRLRLGQTRAIGSITRTSLMLLVPDAGAGKPTTLKHLVQACSLSVPPDVVADELARLIADGFVKTAGRGHLQRVNGWLPLQRRLVAVELKLSRIEEALRQAKSNLGFADESYVAVPSEVANRVTSKAIRSSRFLDAGVGLIGVSKKLCDVQIPAQRNHPWRNEAIQVYAVEKFWRTRSRDS
jgi:hypothetical protein